MSLVENSNIFNVFSWCYGLVAVGLYGLLYIIEIKLDLPICDHECPGLNHVNLKRLIQKVITEAAKLPEIFDQSGTTVRSEECLPYFDPKKYHELLATAVLNKIVDSYQNPKNLPYPENSSGINSGGSDIDSNHNDIKIKHVKQFDIEEEDEDIIGKAFTAFRSRPTSMCLDDTEDTYPHIGSPITSNRTFSSSTSENEGNDLENYIQKHKDHAPLPDLSTDNETNDEDLQSLKSTGTDGTWEDNWLFKSRKFKNDGTSSIAMLVPSPTEEVRALIGDKNADEISDLSEAEGSDNEGERESSSSDLDEKNPADIPNVLIQNKTIIGGKHNLIDLIETTEFESITSQHSLSEAKNDFLIEDDFVKLDKPAQSNDIVFDTLKVDEKDKPVVEEAVNPHVEKNQKNIVYENVQPIKADEKLKKTELFLEIKSEPKTIENNTVESERPIPAPRKSSKGDIYDSAPLPDTNIFSNHSDEHFDSHTFHTESEDEDSLSLPIKPRDWCGTVVAKPMEFDDDSLEFGACTPNNKDDNLNQSIEEDMFVTHSDDDITEPSAYTENTQQSMEENSESFLDMDLLDNESQKEKSFDKDCEPKTFEDVLIPYLTITHEQNSLPILINHACIIPAEQTELLVANLLDYEQNSNDISYDDTSNDVSAIDNDLELYGPSAMSYEKQNDAIDVPVNNDGDQLKPITIPPTDLQSNITEESPMKIENFIEQLKQSVQKISDPIRVHNSFEDNHETSFEFVSVNDDKLQTEDDEKFKNEIKHFQIEMPVPLNAEVFTINDSQLIFAEKIFEPLEMFVDSLTSEPDSLEFESEETKRSYFENMLPKTPQPSTSNQVGSYFRETLEILPSLVENNLTNHTNTIQLTDTNTNEPVLSDTNNIDVSSFSVVEEIKHENETKCEEHEEGESHFIPGSIAEREHLKWQNAVPMENNPYSAEKLQRRLSEKHANNYIELGTRNEEEQDISSVNVLSEQKPASPEKLIDVLKANQTAHKRFGRDYYINEAKRASGERLRRSELEKRLAQSPIDEDKINGDKNIQNISLKSSTEAFLENERNLYSLQRSRSFGDSNKYSNDNIFAARPIMVDEDDPILQKAQKVDLLSSNDRDFYLLPIEEVNSTSLSSSERSLVSPSSLSEDSESTRIYNLTTQKTKIIKETQLSQPLSIRTTTTTEKSAVNKTSPKLPPALSPKHFNYNDTNVDKQNKIPLRIFGSQNNLATSFNQKTGNFIPKKNLSENKMSHITLDIKPQNGVHTHTVKSSPTNDRAENNVAVEEEVIGMLPSVKLLAKSFTSPKQTPLGPIVRPKSLLLHASTEDIGKVEISSPKEQPSKLIITEPNLLQESERYQPMAPGYSISGRSISIKFKNELKEAANNNDISIKNNNIYNNEEETTQIIPPRTPSPVPVPGTLKKNLAFFENLKKQ